MAQFSEQFKGIVPPNDHQGPPRAYDLHSNTRNSDNIGSDRTNSITSADGDGKRQNNKSVKSNQRHTKDNNVRLINNYNNNNDKSINGLSSCKSKHRDGSHCNGHNDSNDIISYKLNRQESGTSNSKQKNNSQSEFQNAGFINGCEIRSQDSNTCQTDFSKDKVKFDNDDSMMSHKAEREIPNLRNEDKVNGYVTNLSNSDHIQPCNSNDYHYKDISSLEREDSERRGSSFQRQTRDCSSEIKQSSSTPWNSVINIPVCSNNSTEDNFNKQQHEHIKNTTKENNKIAMTQCGKTGKKRNNVSEKHPTRAIGNTCNEDITAEMCSLSSGTCGSASSSGMKLCETPIEYLMEDEIKSTEIKLQEPSALSNAEQQPVKQSTIFHDEKQEIVGSQLTDFIPSKDAATIQRQPGLHRDQRHASLRLDRLLESNTNHKVPTESLDSGLGNIYKIDN